MKFINERGSGAESPNGGAFPAREVPVQPNVIRRATSPREVPVQPNGAGILHLDLMKFPEAICHGAIEETSSTIRNFIDSMYPSGSPTLFGEIADTVEIIGSIPRVCVEKAVEWTVRGFGVPEPIPSLAGKVAGWWIGSLRRCDSAVQTFRVFDVAVYTGDLSQCKSVRDLVQHDLQEEMQGKLEHAVRPEGEEQARQPEPVLVSTDTLRMSADLPTDADSRLLILIRSLAIPCKCRNVPSAQCFYATECGLARDQRSCENWR